VSDSPAGSEDDSRCTTRSGNAHKTDKAEEREVLYPWHPWVGCVVLVHEVIEKADGVVLRCSRDGEAAGRWLELPAWMFDRAACLPMQVARCPRVDFAALSSDDLLLFFGAPLLPSGAHKTGKLAFKPKEKNGKTSTPLPGVDELHPVLTGHRQ
jgi:hypothetical protein